METCKCEHYHDAVERFRIYILGTIHPVNPRVEVPDSVNVDIRKVLASEPRDPRRDKPYVIPKYPTPNRPEPKNWIPMVCGSTSAKLVYECKSKLVYSQIFP